jgi:uncharacterized pyridoxal phosphate-containing UPF0001 family protein
MFAAKKTTLKALKDLAEEHNKKCNTITMSQSKTDLAKDLVNRGIKIPITKKKSYEAFVKSGKATWGEERVKKAQAKYDLLSSDKQNKWRGRHGGMFPHQLRRGYVMPKN